MSCAIIILAAGRGTRMCSKQPKVLHQLAGKPLLARVVEAARAMQPSQIIVVYGKHKELLQQACPDDDVCWVKQEQQRGTGDALKAGMEQIAHNIQQVMVLSGDVPLISAAILSRLRQETKQVGLLTAKMENPDGLGRIIRDSNHNFVQIIEEVDATEQQKKLKEINAGIYVFPTAILRDYLPKLQANNNQQEYYLTEVVAMAAKNGHKISTLQVTDNWQVAGVNTRDELIKLERIYQQQQAKRLMKKGVTICDPTRFDLRGEIEVGLDVLIDVNVVLEGKVVIEDGVAIGPNCYIKDSILRQGAVVLANSMITDADIGQDAKVGPFARIRPKTVLARSAKVGNFVEVKGTYIGEFSKANHLSYLGDATIGNKVNIGAGTITCNYDGVSKHQTVIEDEVFIGSDSQLIAPITIKKRATVAAGTTVLSDVPAEQLTLNKKEQKNIADWQRPEAD